ncbi:MAG TPA: cytochrome C [Blastocatellia bacterium]|jgi:cytochrome c peroxidase|nr:cytochrome C [Blastocatellia bacterium]
MVGLGVITLDPIDYSGGLVLAQENTKSAPPKGESGAKADSQTTSERMIPDSAAGFKPDWDRPYPQYQKAGKGLLPFPRLRPGDITPVDLYRYIGAGTTSFASVDDVENFDAFYERLSEQKPKVMARWKDYMSLRYDFTCEVDPKATMSRSKPIPVGPVARLPKGIKTWEELAALSPREIAERDLFPEGFRPLAHPLQSTAHQLFPQVWTKIHPEHQRFDVDFDIPDEYLPEFPPPLFLTTRPDLGDVSKGREITQANFRELFDGIITPEQIEGLRLLVSKFPTTWFNQTKHRLTREPARGTACFDCHVNGHSNGAIELDPGTRPTLARVRLDTPSLRGNNTSLLFSLKRSIRSLDHFAEVEEYFDGDISLQTQIGGRQLDKVSTNRMGDFNSIIGFPPAPKLDRLGRLDPSKASAEELRGEALFFGKAKCSQCHSGPYYSDNSMHDLKVEDFYVGRAEGWVKTFSLRGIKDSPPYFHDGRLPTLEDSVEFFNLIFQLKLQPVEKKELVAFLRCL